jgi:hypothetical protein
MEKKTTKSLMEFKNSSEHVRRSLTEFIKHRLTKAEFVEILVQDGYDEAESEKWATQIQSI